MIAVVTGGSAGIGLAICHRLLEDGYEVISLARRKSPLDHPKLHSLEVDLMDRAATTAAAHDIARRFEVTTLIHNAGVIRPALVADAKLEDLDALVELHLGCAIQLLQACLPSMRVPALRPRRAAVVTRGRRPGDPHQLLGDQGRHARHGAHLGARAGARRHHRQRGRARTGAHRHVHEVVAAGSDKERALAAAVPVRRLGEAADVARAVRFFVDAANGFVTGQVLYVCGGTSVGSLTL
jgi:NAD(P)-dependent dehydrogenase (short-subunit alcohol dehydrogenase family)